MHNWQWRIGASGIIPSDHLLWMEEMCCARSGALCQLCVPKLHCVKTLFTTMSTMWPLPFGSPKIQTVFFRASGRFQDEYWSYLQTQTQLSNKLALACLSCGNVPQVDSFDFISDRASASRWERTYSFDKFEKKQFALFLTVSVIIHCLAQKY